MGRRALPKIDPQLDLSKHFFALEEWPEGKPIAEVFAKRQPIEIEVGCGKGLFLRTAAQERSEHNFIGIEIAGKYARYSASKLASLRLENAVLFRGDGERLLREHTPESSIAAVHVYFPDPWWKARHRRRRVMNELFVQRVEQILEVGGELHFWTDVQEYFETALETLRDHTSLDGPFEVAEKAPLHDLDYRTHFERRMRQHGQPVYRSLFRRSGPT